MHTQPPLKFMLAIFFKALPRENNVSLDKTIDIFITYSKIQHVYSSPQLETQFVNRTLKLISLVSPLEAANQSLPITLIFKTSKCKFVISNRVILNKNCIHKSNKLFFRQDPVINFDFL